MSFLGQFLTPLCLCLALLLVAAFSTHRPRLAKASLWSAIAVLLLGGNDWIARWISAPLEWRIQAPNPIPDADAIVVLGGALEPKEWPRRTIEVSEAGDRVLYAFELFKQGKAPRLLCTGGKSESGVRDFSEGEDMRSMLVTLGVPADAILVESASGNTMENATLSRPLLEAAHAKRILLVTSALHMPRSLETFQRQLPGMEIIPAPTDYAFASLRKLKPRTAIEGCIPSGGHASKVERALHEYVGMLYYRLKSLRH